MRDPEYIVLCEALGYPLDTRISNDTKSVTCKRCLQKLGLWKRKRKWSLIADTGKAKVWGSRGEVKVSTTVLGKERYTKMTYPEAREIGEAMLLKASKRCNEILIEFTEFFINIRKGKVWNHIPLAELEGLAKALMGAQDTHLGA